MCGFDANNFSDRNSNSVCVKCFSEEDICRFIEDFAGSAGCSFCGCDDSPTAPFEKLCRYMRECLKKFFSFAAENLPYESREGGYLGKHWDTYDLLCDELQLDLSRDLDGRLLSNLSIKIGDEIWCEYDWLSLDYDELLNLWWKEFCRIIQHERRFFFAIPRTSTEKDENLSHDDEQPAPLDLLTEIVSLADELNLVNALSAGTKFYRSRCYHPDNHHPYRQARELGPQPLENSFMANRMNPPGIPMMYGAETRSTAVLEEKKCPCVAVGQFEFECDVRILDLADLPKIPSIISGMERRKLLGLVFMHAFANDIARPVSHNEGKLHIEYIPSQVITEYIRDSQFNGSTVDGIRYPSNFDTGERNLVLFATQENLIESNGTLVSQRDNPPSAPWIRLVDTHLDKRPDRLQTESKTAQFYERARQNFGKY